MGDGNLDLALERQIDDVVASLRAFGGFRTLWLDPEGVLWHAEPEDDALEGLGHRYIGTFMRPAGDDLRVALGGIRLPQVACLDVGPPLRTVAFAVA